MSYTRCQTSYVGHTFPEAFGSDCYQYYQYYEYYVLYIFQAVRSATPRSKMMRSTSDCEGNTLQAAEREARASLAIMGYSSGQYTLNGLLQDTNFSVSQDNSVYHTS